MPSNQPLTPEQIDYIKTTTTTRGAAYDPTYQFEMCRNLPSGFDIHANTATGDHVIGAYHGKDGWQTDEALFHKLVDECLVELEKEIQRKV